MKIDTKPLKIGKNSIDVLGSWGQQDQADEVMIKLYEIDANRDDPLKSLKAERESMKAAMSFFKDIFHLTAKETEKIFNEVPGETMNQYLSYACGLVKGAPERSFHDFEEELKAQSAPKGDTQLENTED